MGEERTAPKATYPMVWCACGEKPGWRDAVQHPVEGAWYCGGCGHLAVTGIPHPEPPMTVGQEGSTDE